jgi:hypothetical protein
MKTQGRVRVFVSSTIADFADLRSALKYWLDEMGYECQMSEFGDFFRETAQNTVDSCLSVISTCDYYVLLIGGRKGYCFEQDPSLSMTRLEFRHAMELSVKGEITPVVLIRDSVLAVLREHRSIRDMFPDLGTLPTAGTEQLDDPAFTQSFIEEVRATSIEGQLANMPGNIWTHHFGDFGDLATILRIALSMRGNLRRRALMHNLAWEIEDNIANLCSKHDGVPIPSTHWAGQIRDQFQLGSIRPDQAVKLTWNQAQHLVSIWMFGVSHVDRLVSDALGTAIHSGEFLTFDQLRKELVPSGELLCMYELNARIRHLQLLVAQLRLNPINEQCAELAGALMGRQRSFSISAFSLISLFASVDAIQNVLRICIELYRWLMGDIDHVVMPSLNSTSPIPDSAEALRNEEATHDDVRRWLRNAAIRDQFTGLKSATAEDYDYWRNEYPEYEPLFAELGRRFEPGFRTLLEEFKDRQNRDGLEEATEWFQQEVSSWTGDSV